jgi:putative DNA primase/helicase
VRADDSLYRTAELHGTACFVVGRTHDADRLARAGVPAAAPAGAWRAACARQLLEAGIRRVVVLPSNDEPGRAHGRAVAASCRRVGIAAKVVSLTDVPTGGGVADWLDRGGAAEELAELLDGSTEEPAIAEPLSDVGNARRFAAAYGEDLRYVPAWGKWLVWTGQRWQEDETGTVIERAKDLVRALLINAAHGSGRDSQELAKHALRSQAAARVQAMVALAETEKPIPVTPDQLDADPWLLNVLNGTLNLRTGELQPHRREDLITKLAPVAYDPAAPCPRWEALLKRILGGDDELIGFVQRAAGYSLTGDTREQCAFFPWGTGANGKSTLLNALQGVLGDYARQTPPETLLLKREGGIPNDLARLHGARFVCAVETEAGRRLAEAQLKQMTGGDRIVARFLNREFFEFVPQFKVWLATNHRPVIRGTDGAIWRRIRLIPFTVTIPDAEQDRELPEKLKIEYPGILRWLVEGCLAWQRAAGLGMPAPVRDAVAGYRAEQDALAPFLNEQCVTGAEAGADAETSKAALYADYTGWCAQSGEKPMSKVELGKALKERGFTDGRSGEERFWRGILLRAAMDWGDR